MIMLGIDAHKRTHTVVAVDELGRRLRAKTTTATTTKDHLELIQWADQFGTERTWAVEDCRHLSRRLERDLIAERTRHINRLRWHLHDIDPAWAPKDRALTTMKHLAQTHDRLAELDTVVAQIARDLVEWIRALTIDINVLEAELDERTKSVAPHLRQVHGVAAVSAAKFIGEVAGISRFRSRHAFARHNGTAPTPVWSGNTERHGSAERVIDSSTPRFTAWR